jgi:hypothetical protein
MLKSQVVPPVCPVCPPQIIKNYISTNKNEDNYGRQSNGSNNYGRQSDYYNPELKYNTQPGFSIPNLNIFGKQEDYSDPDDKKYLPLPVLNSFSSFGL